jgi:hypothetical protein
MVVVGHNSVLSISCNINYLLTDARTSFTFIPVKNHCYTISFLRLSVILAYIYIYIYIATYTAYDVTESGSFSVFRSSSVESLSHVSAKES